MIMGDLLTAAAARTSVASLNGLFRADRVEATKVHVNFLRSTQFPYLLTSGYSSDPKTKRQKTLRFAAFVLMGNLKVTTAADHDPSGGNFREWLRWLTWLSREDAPNGGSNPNDWQYGAGMDQAIKPHDHIVEAIIGALAQDPAMPIWFDWQPKNPGNRPELSITMSGTSLKRIIVSSIDHSNVPNGRKSDEDDDFPM